MARARNIRPDPEDEGTYLVPVSDSFIAALTDQWSDPMQLMLQDGVLIMRPVPVNEE